MGLNVNLAKMLGLNTTIICPKCKEESDNGWDDFDIECGNPNPKSGVWHIDVSCIHCDHEWRVKYKLNPTQI
jgi:hypothetical protein